MLRYMAPAKINPVLEVLGRRDDGYHEVRSLMQAVNLCDVLTFKLAEKVSFECTEPSLQNTENLVVKAAELLRRVTGYSRGASIKLEKCIPWGTGLGGGSSDAAATLLALNELWDTRLEISELLPLAAKLGSDVPFFIYGGTALTEGRGEKVTPLHPISGWFVILVPPLSEMGSKTKQLYSLLNTLHYTEGLFVDEAVETLSRLEQVRSPLLFNVFDNVAFDAFNRLKDWWGQFEETGATNIHLAGSGPAMFASVESQTRAEELCDRLRRQRLKAYAVSALKSWRKWLPR